MSRPGNLLPREISAISWLAATWVTVALLAGGPLTIPADAQPETSERSRIIAFGDVHGGVVELRRLLKALELMDDSGNWSGGETRLVSLGDLLDRGPDSRKVMDLLMRLESQAPTSGGNVYLVLGNHEIMNLTGDLRYVSSPEFAAFSGDEDPEQRAAARALALTTAAENEVLDADGSDPRDSGVAFDTDHPPGFFGHRVAFQPDGTYGSWLLSKPQVLELDGTAFVHGGLSEHFAGETIDAFNERAFRELTSLLTDGHNLIDEGRIPPWQDLLSAPGTSSDTPLPESFLALRNSLVFGETGPSWYRGTASCHPLIESSRLSRVLEAQSLDRIVMGHTPTNPRVVQSRFNGQAILADTGMLADYYRGQPSAVIIEGGALTAVTLGEDGQLIPQLGQPAVDVRTGDEAELMSALEKALASQPSIQADRPFAIQLNGRAYRAVLNTARGRAQKNLLAAHALDKLLGLGLVAPTILHRHAGRDAVVEVVPAQSLSETDRVTGNVYRPNACTGISDYQLMYALDALIGNDARTGESIRYDRSTWLMYLTGHGAAFPTSQTMPRYLENTVLKLPATLHERLARLDEDGVEQTLGSYLGDRQIRALLERRDEMIETWPVEE